MKLCAALIVVIFAVLVICDPTRASPSRVRRQGWNWGQEDDGEQRPVRPTPRPPRPTGPTPQPSVPTTSTGATTPSTGGITTPSSQLADCMSRCRATPEYNPVCGTNRQTYPNIGGLNCAKGCGVVVERLFTGTCSTVPQ